MYYSTNITYLNLEGHVDLEKNRYIYFITALIVYLLIICCNSVVIYVIFMNKSLHEPMYIFIAALLVNSLCGTTVFYPKLLIDFLSERQVISYHACTFQAFCIYTYAISEFSLLSAMAYDRYVSICKPLQYATLVNMSTVKKLLFLSWFLPSCENIIGIILTNQLHLCKLNLNRIYCDNYSVVRLSCGDTLVNNVYGLFLLVISIIPPVAFIVYSYIRILGVCIRSSKDFRKKALQTCLPHLFIVTNFSINAFFEVLNARLQSSIPLIISVILSVDFLVIPPLFNPIIYGLKLQEIQNNIKMLLSQKNNKLLCF